MDVQVYKTGIVTANGDVVKNNIFLNSDFHNTYQQTTGWDTVKNGTLLANNWGGYNSGVSNQATCYHAHLTKFDGRYVYEYIREAETWLGVSQSGMQNRITPNTTYTFSVEQYVPTGSNNYLTAGLYYRKTGTTSYSFLSGCPRIVPATAEKDRWVRGVFTFTTLAELDTTGGVSWYIYGYSGTGKVYMCNPKLELGSTSTSISLNSTEGYVESSHGFSEIGLPNTKFFENTIEAIDFIEY